MAALTPNADKPGRGALRQAFASGHGATFSGTFAFDSSYPTGGEDLSDLWGYLRTVRGVSVPTNGTYIFVADLTNKKLLAYTALGTEVGNGVSLATLTAVPVFAWGDR